MSNLLNSSINNVLASFGKRASQGVVSAIQQASVKTGVDFAYLVKQAAAESGFQADAKASTSSASGLYQFIESTWLNMVEKYGPKHGITTVGMSREDVLNLRNDPEKASVMAAEFASENERFLRSHYDGEIGATELYFAHFLGAGNAAAFLNARQENGMKEAAYMLPAAAKANYNVFYDTDGRAKTLDEVYAYFDKKFAVESDVKREVATDMVVESYQNPFLEYPEKIQEQNRAQIERYASSSMSSSSLQAYHNMIANPLELILLAQMDLPIAARNDVSRGDFELFSARTAYK